ncbi:MAG: IS5 family transposase [Bacteroidetes bacterium]|jgi:putative transposase|nr:IS5 family transposase [Bacteroidota bacterium]
MRQQQHAKRYNSDLTDSQWQHIKSHFDTSRQRQHDLRYDILDGILYLVKTGCQWRMLPGEFAPWQTVYYYFRRWREQGVIGYLLSVARRKARRDVSREPEPSAAIIDCQSVPVTRAGGLSGFDGYKKVKGRKRHIAVDTQGLTWAVLVHAANEHESGRAMDVIEAVDQESDRLEVIFADRAYQGDLEEEVGDRLEGVHLEITEPEESNESSEAGFAVEPKRWIVERTLGWFGGWRRLSKEYERLTATSEAMVELASLQLALNRLN